MTERSDAMGGMRAGGCLCGAVRFRARVAAPAINACHCGQCRTWTGGGPYFALSVTEADLAGDVALYSASDWGERGFCPVCGATLFWRMKGGPITNLAVGLFEDQSDLTVATEIFVDRRAPWHPPFDGASQSTEAQESAKLKDALRETPYDRP